MQFSVVVCTVTYNNSPHELARFAHGYVQARSRAASSGLSVRLLCRDNGSPSALAELVGEAAAAVYSTEPTWQATSERNLGYGPAMHGLWAQAFEDGADAVVTANPDGTFHPECVVRLREAAQRKPGHLIEARQFPSEHAKYYRPEDQSTDWASGCCVYVSRDLFQLVGNLDPAFWLYMEDVDFSWRVRLAGRHIYFCPTALYGHETVQRELSARARCEMLLAGRILGWKWGGTAFQANCERALARQFPEQALPVLGERTSPTVGHERVACFDRLFAFAPSRWVL